jgi:hypothetical protein
MEHLQLDFIFSSLVIVCIELVAIICLLGKIYDTKKKITKTEIIYLADDDVIVLKNGTYYRYRLDKKEELATYTGIEDYIIQPD